ncbi:MAG TPA: methyltransferase domain-containing protein [Acidimicrobiales bacterium]|nr:methyltransferase domain-containing protein [Acidimicrobiales bacterium]
MAEHGERARPAVHDVAARGFSSAGAYERARPEYPAAAVDALVVALALGPATTVVDLGAGTGKLTRALVPTGARLIAVEPLVAMRTELACAVPAAHVVGGTAEAIPLAAAAADAVVAAQAFHWFSGDRAVAEIHRVLRPGGGLGLVWNELVWSVPWVGRLGKVLDPLAASVPRFRTGRWRHALERTRRFGALEERRFPYARRLDHGAVVDWVATTSWVAVLPEHERSDVLRRVAGVVADEPAPLEVPYQTFVYWCRRLH